MPAQPTVAELERRVVIHEAHVSLEQYEGHTEPVGIGPHHHYHRRRVVVFVGAVRRRAHPFQLRVPFLPLPAPSAIVHVKGMGIGPKSMQEGRTSLVGRSLHIAHRFAPRYPARRRRERDQVRHLMDQGPREEQQDGGIRN
jgi:hypothetical protein